MSFLFEDDTLIKLMNDSGLLDKLNKYAQESNQEAKLLAIKLAKKLASEWVGEQGTNDTEIYVKDLVSLTAYLQYLDKYKKQSADGHPIALQAKNINAKQFADTYKKSYFPYNGFLVYVSGLKSLINELLIESEKDGNQVMKPLVNGLHAESIKSFGDAFNNTDEDEDGGTAENIEDPDGIPKNIPASTMYMKHRPDGNKGSGKAKQETTLDQDLESMRNLLPFQSTSSLSPYDMTFFIRSFNNVLAKSVKQKVNLNAGPIVGQFVQFNESIERNYTEWVNFCAKASALAPNANSAREEVPYDLAGRPFTHLETLFGNTPNAREGAQRLLQMVSLTSQALLSLQRSPDLTNLLGKDIISSQTRRAQAFINNLETYTR